MASSIFLISLFCGAYAVITQAYLAREFLVVFLGNEMSLAVLLAGWLAGVAAGARVARAEFFSRTRPAYLVSVALLAWVVLFPAVVMLVRISRSILDVPPGLYAPLGKLFLAGLLFAAPFAALGGVVFVSLCRLAEAAKTSRSPVGLVYVAEALGGIAGGAAFAFLLAGREGPFAFGFAVYPAQAAVILFMIWAAARRGLLPKGMVGTATIGVVLIAAAGAAMWAGGRGAVLDANTHIARMMTIADGLVVGVRESPYQNVTAAMRSGQYTVYGNGEPLATFPEPVLAERDAHLILTEARDPSDVLVIGGGPDVLPPILAYGVKSVDYVELDPAVIEVERPHLTPECLRALESPLVHVRYGDARGFVERAAAEGRRYDAVIMRLPDPATLLLNRLYTREFFAAARAAMREDGVIAAQATLADGYLSGEVGRYAGDMYTTMRSVFPEVIITPEVNALFFAGAGKGTVTTSPEELSRRFAARRIHSDLYPALFESIFPRERTAAVNDALANSGAGIVNTDWRPTTYAASLTLWARYSGSTLARWVLAAADAPRWLVFAAVMAVVVAAAPLSCGGRSRRGAQYAVFLTGYAAMSVAVMLVYAFQVTAGYVYEWMGLLVGAFAAGLAAGGFAGARATVSRGRLFAADALVAGMPLLVIAALTALSSAQPHDMARWAIPVVAAACGAVTGFEFPIAAGVLAARGRSAGDAGGRLQAADQLGACAGALVTGIVVVPALGLWMSLALIAAVKVVSAAVVGRAAFEGDKP